MTLTKALEAMNAELGLSIRHDRVKEWQDNKRSPSLDVVNYMLKFIMLETDLLELPTDKRVALYEALKVPR